MSLKTAIEDRFMRMQVGPKVRKRIYTILARQIENGAMLHTTLEKLYAMYSNDGRKPTRAPAMMIREVIAHIDDGHSFAEGLTRWVDSEESTLISAGERSGDLGRAFKDALYLIEQRKAIRGAVVATLGAVIPMLLSLVVMLLIITKKVIPPFAHILPADQWEGAARPMYLMSYFVSHFGLATLVLLGLLLIAVVLSMPHVTGNFRYYLDKFPPWSINRRAKGSMFLLNIAVLIGSGVKLQDAIALLSSKSSRYLQERLNAVLHGVRKGLFFGQALVEADFDFPDRDTNRLLTLLDSLDSFDVALRSFAHDDLEDLREFMKVAMVLLFYVSLILVALLNVVIIMGNVWLQSQLGTHG